MGNHGSIGSSRLARQNFDIGPGNTVHKGETVRYSCDDWSRQHEGDGGPHKGMLIAIALVFAFGAAPAMIATVDAGCQIAPLSSCLSSTLHLVHVATCNACRVSMRQL